MTIVNHRLTAESVAADLYGGAKTILLTEDGSVGERLLRAYGEMAIHATQLAEQLPGSLGHRMLAVHLELTGGEPGTGRDESMALRRTLGTMTKSEQTRAALDIAQLADDLEHDIQAVRAVLDSMA